MTSQTIPPLRGPRHVITLSHPLYPELFTAIPDPPGTLYVIGDPTALRPGLAIIGSRKPTAYGLRCAHRFASLAASRGLVIHSGGAYGCDREAHVAALEAGGRTVVVLGGGCDRLYPAVHRGLFQKVIDQGGAVFSENPWDHPPKPHTFRARNRLIAGLSKVVLIVEAGLPSGTLITADAALASGREVLVVPGAIDAANSRGTNYLLSQGATPVVDDEGFLDLLTSCLGDEMSSADQDAPASDGSERDPLIEALKERPLTIDEMLELASSSGDPRHEMPSLLAWLARSEGRGRILRFPDGRYGLGR